jgi:multiple sugar transport system permease protein
MDISSQAPGKRVPTTRSSLGLRPLRASTHEAMVGYLSILPWFIGFLAFTLVPLGASIYLSFTEYNLVRPARWIGLQNYTSMFQDERFLAALQVTCIYVVVAVPLHLIAAFLVAEMMNRNVPFLSLFRTIYYLPAIVRAVATYLLWSWIFNPE